MTHRLLHASRHGAVVAAALFAGILASPAAAQETSSSDDPPSFSDYPSCDDLLANGKLPANTDCQERTPGNRWFIVHVSKLYVDTAAVPLLLDLHGFKENAIYQKRISGQSGESDRKDFVAVWPQAVFNGLTGTQAGPQWNASGSVDRPDDIAFLTDDVIKQVETWTSIDPDRVYITGLSNGAQMTQRLACRAPETVTAIAPVSNPSEQRTCSPGKSVPMIAFRGTNDEINAFNDDFSDPTNKDVRSLQQWSNINGCDTGASIETAAEGTGSSHNYSYSGCLDEARTVVISGAYHHAYLYNQQHPLAKREEQTVPTENQVDIADYMWTSLFKGND